MKLEFLLETVAFFGCRPLSQTKLRAKSFATVNLKGCRGETLTKGDQDPKDGNTGGGPDISLLCYKRNSRALTKSQQLTYLPVGTERGCQCLDAIDQSYNRLSDTICI